MLYRNPHPLSGIVVIDSAPYIDKRNVALWEEINHSDLSIFIEKSDEPNYKCHCKSKEATIYVLTSKPDAASFAHELLHVKMFADGITAGCCLRGLVLQHPILNKIITTSTLDVITNCMEHVKMLPKFLAMGYCNAEFISDYHSRKMDIQDFTALCNWYRIDKTGARDRFIGTYCAMRADNNPQHKYAIYYGLLKQLDKPLYDIVNRFWNEWLQYDTDKRREPWEPDYGPLISDFVHELGECLKAK